MFRNPTTDLIVVLVIVLLIFGPKRLPGLGKQLGQGLREFKESVTGGDSSDSEEPERPEIARTAAAPVAGATASVPNAAAPSHEPADVPAAQGSADIGSERSS
jgi:sec-independent protein translocase protein TatA